MSCTAPLSEVLYLATSGQVGGAERCLLAVAGELPALGFTPAVVLGSPGPLTELLQQREIPVEIVALPNALRGLSRYFERGWRAHLLAALQLPGYLRRLARVIRQRRPALVHSNGLKMHLASGMLWSWRAARGPRLIWHLHDFPADIATERPGLRRRPLANRGLAVLSGAPDLVIANSTAVAQAYRERFPRLAPKLRVIHNGVELDRFAQADGSAMRGVLQVGERDFVIGMVAILAPWKGQEIFLRAAAEARRQAPELKFALIGDDVYDTAGHGGKRAALEQLSAELGLETVVRFPGFVRDDIAGAYAALNVMVHASTRPEPFGRTIIEAMAAGVPVIAAAAGGVAEIISHGRDGWLTPPGDVDALAQAMLLLYRNDALRRNLAEQAAMTVRERFSSVAIAAATVAAYREALGN